MTKARIISLATTLLVAVASQSIADESSAVARAFASSIQWRETTVGAEAFSDPDAQRNYFGADFSSMGTIPLVVQIQNNGKEPIRVAPAAFQLRLPSGEMATQYSAFDAAALFVGKPWRAQNLALGFGGILGLLASQGVQSSQRDAIQARIEDFQLKALKAGVINPGETSAGFLYFVLETKPSPFDEATLLLPLDDRTDIGGVKYVELRITDIRFPTFSGR